MHRLDCLPILPDDTVQRPASVIDIADDPAKNPLISVCIHKNLEIHQLDQPGFGQDENAFQDDDRIGLNPYGLLRPIVHRIVIDRHVNRPARFQLADMLTEQLCVKGIRMVIIELCPLLVREIVISFIIIVMTEDTDLILPEITDQCVRQSSLAAPAPTGDADYDCIHLSLVLSGIYHEE